MVVACWSFGCPGHGNGPWDTLGGILKRMLRQDTIDEQLMSESGVIKAPHDAAQHLRARVCTPQWKEQHKNVTVNEFVVLEGDSCHEHASY